MSKYEWQQPSCGISLLLPSIINNRNINYSSNFNNFNNYYTAGMTDIVGFVRYRVSFRLDMGSTHHGYGAAQYGYSVRKSDLWVTSVQPYAG